MIWVITPFWSSTQPLSYIGWGKTTQLGYGLGLAMGAKLARPDKLCINVWGDACCATIVARLEGERTNVAIDGPAEPEEKPA